MLDFLHMAKNQYISALYELGQSIWYDNLSRDVLRSGELKNLIDAGVTGLTSNPTIFKKAIADTKDYDDDIKTLLGKGIKDKEELCENLMIADVGAAADLLKPIYESTEGRDGYASIEISPYLARDTNKSIEAGKRLWKTLSRPNIMIKVPATDEGMPVIRELLTSGINVNVTLIFSASVYERVVEEYLSALEARMKANQAIDKIASVASFFVSRVDSITESKVSAFVKEGIFDLMIQSEFDGTLGIANSKLAYQSFLALFGSGRFQRLMTKGAKVQRPLWASTGTKNPKFDQLLYVDALAGPDTVNTLPPQTIAELLKRGSFRNRITEDVEASFRLFERGRDLGLPIEAMLFELQVQGVKLFSDSYTDLLKGIEEKRDRVR